jgi:hypothetical protein
VVLELRNRLDNIKDTRKMRDSINDLAMDMEVTLIKNDYKGGWADIPTATLIRMLQAHVKDLTKSFNNCDPVGVVDDVTDIANYCMMLHENLTQRYK